MYRIKEDPTLILKDHCHDHCKPNIVHQACSSQVNTLAGWYKDVKPLHFDNILENVIPK